MDRQTELALIDELLKLHDEKSPFLDAQGAPSPVDRYADADRFAAESARVLRRVPVIALHGADHLLTDRRDAFYAGGVISAWLKKYL